MPFSFRPGNALVCAMNAHRSGWDGRICRDPVMWSCGGKEDFREHKCDRGIPDCFHIHVFDPRAPSIVIHDTGGRWIFEENLHALDDQIVLFGGEAASEPRGRSSDDRQASVVYGAYRVKRAEKIDPNGWRTDWRLIPHQDGWMRFPKPGPPMPRWRELGGPYVREVERSAVTRLFQQAVKDAEDPFLEWWDETDRARLAHFADELDGWLDVAAGKAPAPAEKRTVYSTGGPSGHRAFAELARGFREETPVAARAPRPDHAAVRPDPAAATPTRAAEDERGAESTLLDPRARTYVVETYGEALAKELMVACLSKPFLILRGEPGVGKSSLARRLVDDPRGERSLVVPIAATWRGSEDLLGWVNPIDDRFAPTPFTNFLKATERAWQRGDRRRRVVIFEEFNLAQPEYWLSEILARSSFAPEDLRGRTIPLGGTSVRGWDEDEHGVTLTPNVLFVGTVNADHTTRPLTPRVLDRSAVVQIDMAPERAIEHRGLELSDDQINAIADLSFRLRSKDASFSLRSAESLDTCLAARDQIGISVWGAIDVVLRQEILSKVRLMAGDPHDQRVLEGLRGWSEDHGAALPRCAETINKWSDDLGAGKDVV